MSDPITMTYRQGAAEIGLEIKELRMTPVWVPMSLQAPTQEKEWLVAGFTDLGVQFMAVVNWMNGAWVMRKSFTVTHWSIAPQYPNDMKMPESLR